MITRRDPVIHGDRHRGPLTKEQCDLYDKNGFLFIPGFFSPDEAKALQGHAQGLRGRYEESGEDGPEVIREPKDNAVRSVFAIHRGDDRFRDLCKDPRLVGIARQIVGSDVYIHQSRINFKPGFKGKSFYWHSDFETWHLEDGMPRMRAVSCSILLSENNEHNGPLMLVPRSHKQFVSCVGETPDNHYKESLRKQEYGVPSTDALERLVETGGIESCKGPAGSVVFFDCNTMHGSSGNISPFPRNNVFYVYNSVENALVDPFCGKTPRPPFIAERNPVPVGDL